MQTEIFKEKARPPIDLLGIGPDSRAMKVWRMLRVSYPGEVNLTTLERVAFTKVTNRISDIRKVCRPLGWDIVNRTERVRDAAYSYMQTLSWYRITEWRGDIS